MAAERAADPSGLCGLAAGEGGGSLRAMRAGSWRVRRIPQGYAGWQLQRAADPSGLCGLAVGEGGGSLTYPIACVYTYIVRLNKS